MGKYLDSIRKMAAEASSSSGTVSKPPSTPNLPKMNTKPPSAPKVSIPKASTAPTPKISVPQPPKASMPQATAGLDLTMPDANEIIADIMGGTRTASLRDEMQKEALLPLILGGAGLAALLGLRGLQRRGYAGGEGILGRMWTPYTTAIDMPSVTTDAAGNPVITTARREAIGYDPFVPRSGRLRTDAWNWIKNRFYNPSMASANAINREVARMVREGIPFNDPRFETILMNRLPGFSRDASTLRVFDPSVPEGEVRVFNPRAQANIQASMERAATRSALRSGAMPDVASAVGREMAGLPPAAQQEAAAVAAKGGMGGKPWMWLLGGLLAGNMLTGGGLFGGGQQRQPMMSMPMMTPPMMY